ncbi:hypothetical protein Tco_1268200, partial [Tanacetum coccineum]
TRRFSSIYLPSRELESRKLRDSHTDKTSDGPEVKAMDTIIARTWNLVDRSLTSAKICPFSDIIPSTVDTMLVEKYHAMRNSEEKSFVSPLGDETLTIRNNRSNGYASIVAGKQRLRDRIGTLERDNLRLRGMLCVERKRVDRL